MFAGAAREVVFANPNVVERIKSNFIPVALKAAHVANPPSGITAELYRELRRTQPAPQGICVMNSAGKVLDWVLSFENDTNIADYFDNAAERYKTLALAEQNVTTRRFRNYPNARLADVPDSGVRFKFPLDLENEPPPTLSNYPSDSLIGKVIGRPIDKNGKPVARTLRQEDYMEATFNISQHVTQELLKACNDSVTDSNVPDSFVRQIVGAAYLGQLDVSPLFEMGTADHRTHWWKFRARRIEFPDHDLIRVTGQSHIAGDGKVWEHDVTLQWQGYVKVVDGEAVVVEMLGKGHEKLNWGRGDVTLMTEPDARHLMAGHLIDLNSEVVYGLSARRGTNHE